MTLVVDASVAFKWFVMEDGADPALRLLAGGEPMVAPDLILAEVCNAAWQSLRKGQLDPAQFDHIVANLTKALSRLVPLSDLITPAAAVVQGTGWAGRVVQLGAPAGEVS